MKPFISAFNALLFLLFASLMIIQLGCNKDTSDSNPPIVDSGKLGTVTDFDGNTYKTRKIGDQWWMAENLKVTHFSDGTEIPLVENIIPWINLGIKDEAYCY